MYTVVERHDALQPAGVELSLTIPAILAGLEHRDADAARLVSKRIVSNLSNSLPAYVLLPS